MSWAKSEVFARCKCGGVIAKHNSNRGMTMCMECWNKLIKERCK